MSPATAGLVGDAAGGLTSQQARRLTDEVKSDAVALWAKLASLYRGQAHLALGYTSWASYCAAEFAMSDATAYRLLQAARVVEQLPMGSSPMSSERVARELTPLLGEPEQLQEVWEEAVERHGPKPTAAEVREVVEEIHNHRAQGTGENEWYTPPRYIEAARALLGTIDLDPASSEIAQDTIRAASYFTREEDGLTREWVGRVWLNPPYAQPAIQQFIEKAVSEHRSGNLTEAVILTHNYTDTAWFHIAAAATSAICFTRGRIGFLSPTGERAAPTQGQAFFYLGLRVDAFTEAFGPFGFVMVPAP